MLCNTCSGTRFVLVQRQQFVTKCIYRKADGTVCWPHEGGTPQRERFPTGKWVGISEICPDCEGTGLAIDPARDPECTMCNGRGERNAWDSSGEWEVEQCDCENPHVDKEVA